MKILICILLTAITLSTLRVCASPGRKQLHVAVIDSGLDTSVDGIPLCAGGLHDFTQDSSKNTDHWRHGTNVASLIAREAGTTGYCLEIFKVFDDENFINDAYERSLKYIVQHEDILLVNLSIAGTKPYEYENRLIKTLLNNNVVIVASAGNDSISLTQNYCDVRPACIDKRIIVVGNKGSNSTNYGPIVDVYEDGNEQFGGGVTMSGTSQATAIVTGKIINKYLKIIERNSK